MADWFQQAVRDIVKRLDETPFLQLVQFPQGRQPRFSTVTVDRDVVAAPELWQGIAEHLGAGSPDTVILVQQLSPTAGHHHHHHARHPKAAPEPEQHFATSSMDEAEARAEETCRRLLSSGLADRCLTGKVGDCCNHSRHAAAVAAAQQQQQPAERGAPAAGLFAVAAAPRARAAVRAAASGPLAASAGTGIGGSGAHYWGLVVQSAPGRRATGAEGCYLLKAVRSASAAGGCSCTHFSLTRVCRGDHLEHQFVQSWLV